MTKEQLKAEIAHLEAEARQLVANANCIAGAIQAYQKVLVSLEQSETKNGASDTIS